MRGADLGFAKVNWGRLRRVVAGAFVVASLATGLFAQQKGQKTFATPEEAAKALYDAAKANDEKALLDIFGASAKEIVTSGDAEEDARSRGNFVKRYDEMNRLVREPDGTVTLYIGSRNWPYPISLRNKGNVWFFDSNAGKYEVLYRRIGYNEVSAIHICDALVSAQKEFYAQQNNQYAQKIFSDEGKKDGLYWKTASGEPQSPVGPLVAGAVTEDFAKNRGSAAVPYRGYYFHILTSQGKDVTGGAKNYIVDGKMTGGFAFVAYPAEYKSSGVMTFVVSADGVVYEKDLGKKTETLAKTMTVYDPGPGWHKAEEPTQETTAEDTTK
ncbi:MAG TPA: DUF2950 domain-containing protein [Candidatus Acidoferrum sp.]|nr:DUF2950 domain-containing protein [Candidatus Acidoferrum sp.]